jgi:hypothetical protein
MTKSLAIHDEVCGSLGVVNKRGALMSIPLPTKAIRQTRPSRRAVLAGGLGGLLAGVPQVLRAQGREAQLGQIWRVPRGDVAAVSVDRAGRSLAETLAAIEDWTIPPGARVQVQLPDGEHAVGNTIALRHPDGARIAIVGNKERPERCRIVSERGHDLIYVGQNHVLGWIDGVTIDQVSRANRGLGSALLADEGGVILTGQKVKITGSYYGVTARRNGIVRCGMITVEKGGDCNYFAFQGGHISAPGATAHAASDPTKNLGSGFVAEYGGSIDCEGAQSSYNDLAGFTALSGGSIRAYWSRAQRNGVAGYLARSGGSIIAHDGRTEMNCGRGVVTEGGSFQGSRHIDSDNMLPKGGCAIRL